MARPPISDPIIEIVKQHNAGFESKNFSKRVPTDFGKNARVYEIAFQGGDGEWRNNYVFERGSKLLPFSSLGELLRSQKQILVPWYEDHDLVRIFIVSIISIIFSLSLVYMVIMKTDMKYLSIVTTPLGLSIGYLVGNVRQHGQNR